MTMVFVESLILTNVKSNVCIFHLESNNYENDIGEITFNDNKRSLLKKKLRKFNDNIA